MKFLHGRTYKAYSVGADFAGVVFLVGIGWAIGRRYVQRPVPHPHQDEARGRVILGTFAVIGDHRVLHRRRCASRSIGRPDFEKWSFVGYPLSALVDTWSTEHAAATRTAGCGSCTSSRSSRSS